MNHIRFIRFKMFPDRHLGARRSERAGFLPVLKRNRGVTSLFSQEIEAFADTFGNLLRVVECRI